jgi:hypothetical protein
MQILGGEEWSPGLYLNANSRVAVLPSFTYYLMDSTVEPYLPKRPGDHGAKLTAFFNDQNMGLQDEGADPYKSVPLFICNSDEGGVQGSDGGQEPEYTYYGNYSQCRWSDKLDHDTMTSHVPHAVKMYHAELLSSPTRPQWLTHAVMNHFWPKPTYEGALPSANIANGSISANVDDALDRAVKKDVNSYLEELKGWRSEAEMKVKLIKKEQILDAFDEVCWPLLEKCVDLITHNNNSRMLRIRPVSVSNGSTFVATASIRRFTIRLLRCSRR